MAELEIVVFGTPTCAWCRKLKNYLKEKKIKFRDVDISKNGRAAKDMVRKSGQQGVPQMWVNGRPIVGFDKQKIDRLLKLK